ncbi:MAG: UvrD-helicase domain-containing protein [Deltaproteobacteria bacterium]|nr:UvrD-helicase domain-containing protein [Deltaproteobacteria bacterium]
MKTNKETIVDASVREQVTLSIDSSIALSAGAGSGKTSVLTARLVEVLAKGTHPSKVAAITFTEKAASELQGRVRDRLEAQLAEQHEDSPRVAHMRTALADFSELTLSTIHAFCRGILLDEALAARFAPATDVAPTEEIAELQKRCVEQWRNSFTERHPTLAAVVNGLTDEKSLEHAGLLLAHYQHYDLVTTGEDFSFSKAVKGLENVLKDLKHAAQPCLDPESCKLLAKVRPLVLFLENTLAFDAEAAVANAIRSKSMVVKAGNSGRKPDWPNTSKQDYLDAVYAAAEWQNTWREHLHHVVVHDLHNFFVPAFAEEKRSTGVITFDDLLLRAANLLRTQPDARKRLSTKLKCVLIDEVQDTDPMQAEVATLLTRSVEEDCIWYESAPEPGRLFAVGDSKQSIYRFRGADVKTFSRIQEVIDRDGQLHELTQNFRSVPGIVNWVNATFRDLDGHLPQAPFREAAALDPVVFLPTFKVHGKDDDEVDSMLRHLRDLLDKGAKVVDRNSGKLRLMHPGDVMVLLPSWTKAEEVAASIRHSGMPCNVEGGKQFYKRDEVRLCLAALSALEEPGDAQSLVFALRGLFGISMEQLAAHVQAEGSWRYTISQPTGPVADAFTLLRHIRKHRSQIALGEMLDRLLEGSRALAAWSLLPDGDARVANVEKLKALLAEAEEATTSPAEALAVMAKRSKTKTDERDLSLVDDEGKAVRITTLFKAKGLEAPVVFLVHASRKKMANAAFIDHAKHRIALRMKDLQPPNWEDFKVLEAEADVEERRRWMYVAATRARDQLVVTGGEHTGFSPKTGLLNWDIATGLPELNAVAHEAIHDLSDKAAGDATDNGIEASSVRVRLASSLPEVSYQDDAFPTVQSEVEAALTKPPKGGDGDGEERQALLRSNVKRAAKEALKWRSVSEDVARRRMPARIVATEDASTSSAARVGASGGTVVHQVLEHLDLKKPSSELKEQAASLVDVFAKQAFLQETTTADCKDIVEKILLDPVMAQIRNAPFHWKESPFAYQKGKNTIITGTIDLCFPLDDSLKKWMVVDWKSHVPKEGNALRRRYEEQLKHYLSAMLKTVGQDENITIETKLVGPYEQLEDVATLHETLSLLDDAHLASGIARLSKRLKVQRASDQITVEQLQSQEPGVYVTVGDPGIADLLVAWEQEKIGIADGLDDKEQAGLKKEGWKTYDLESGNVTDALAFAASALGLEVEAEEEESVADQHEATEEK